MHSTTQAAPKKESEQTTPCSSKTEDRPNPLKYRKVVSKRLLQANRANAARSNGTRSRRRAFRMDSFHFDFRLSTFDC